METLDLFAPCVFVCLVWSVSLSLFFFFSCGCFFTRRVYICGVAVSSSRPRLFFSLLRSVHLTSDGAVRCRARVPAKKHRANNNGIGSTNHIAAGKLFREGDSSGFRFLSSMGLFGSVPCFVLFQESRHEFGLAKRSMYKVFIIWGRVKTREEVLPSFSYWYWLVYSFFSSLRNSSFFFSCLFFGWPEMKSERKK